MIAREWRCLCPEDTAAGFLDHLRATGVDDTRNLPGCLGRQILRRDAGGGMIEFTLYTYWTSEQAESAYSGENSGRAVLYPGDEDFRIVPETTVLHYEVLESVLPERLAADRTS